MFHKATDLKFLNGTSLEVTFQTGEVKKYDMANLFKKYPALEQLDNRELFLSGRLIGNYGIIWSDELDIETETIFEEGELVRTTETPANIDVGEIVKEARITSGLSQKELSQLTGIDQGDISKIERGVANPSVNTLKRIAVALNKKIVISLK